MARIAAESIRILVVDDHVLFRESVARLLHAEPGFEVVAHCGSVNEGLQLLKSQEIDIVLLDLDLGAEKGTDLLESLSADWFTGRVLLVTAGVPDSEIANLIRKGICGVFLKHGSPAVLIQGIREVVEGKVLFGQDQLRRALGSEDDFATQQTRTRLTERERRVLAFIFEGLANKQIADRLGISESAVKACLQQLFAKTGVRTRTQLVGVALQQYRGLA